nr:hypothetical protein [Tanacetum cinerariifolium]
NGDPQLSCFGLMKNSRHGTGLRLKSSLAIIIQPRLWNTIQVMTSFYEPRSTVPNNLYTYKTCTIIEEEMRRLEATGTYIDDEINRLARGGGVSGSGGCGNNEEGADDQDDEDEDGDGDT